MGMVDLLEYDPGGTYSVAPPAFAQFVKADRMAGPISVLLSATPP